MRQDILRAVRVPIRVIGREEFGVGVEDLAEQPALRPRARELAVREEDALRAAVVEELAEHLHASWSEMAGD